ncbi:3021_t:CDS:2, partial [Gigaspora rosea]
AKSEDNILALRLENLEDISLALHHTCRKCRKKKFMDDQSM